MFPSHRNQSADRANQLTGFYTMGTLVVKRVTPGKLNCSVFNTPRNSISSAPHNLKSYFTGHRTANTIQLFVPIKRIFFGSIFFRTSHSRRGTSQRLLDKFSHLFICTPLKQTLSSGQKPVYTVKISALEWFLLILCKLRTVTRFSNLCNRNNPALCF